ncbi:GNAT family N-acetyltransferase [Fusibacter ferrireducens]|uniref:GNAT family N-acetyltransferase n=1 Tax=Fusibacter ferrireducens TaxID=2785058 RepID=A0ABR9ZNE9_9FIRM|nr:GNAT family N-acetyltransferase [Fusibacter ferrireducens]MBF4691982.1 GNAT family N-acetyltransferase [Fusibacter ferrireducens]
MIKNQGTVELETNRIILRRFTMEDADAMFNNWASDEEISRYMRWPFHRQVAETKQIINSWLELYKRENFYLWGIVLKETNTLVGSINLFAVNEFDACGDVGYCIGRAFWGKGIASHALQAVIEYAFNTIGFNRIESYHAIQNPASGKVMSNVGMQFEGSAKQKYRSNQGYEDCNMYAIIKEAYHRESIIISK